MKLGFVSRYPWSMQFGGAELQAAQYIDGMKLLGHEAEFVDFYSRSIDVDIVHCVGMNWETETILKSARRLGKKTVLSPVFYVEGRTEKTWKLLSILSGYRFNGLNKLRNALLEADVVLPNSCEEARQLSAIFKVPMQRFTVLNNGVDTDYFNCLPDNSHPSKNTIVSVAMIDERKNTLGLLKAFLRSGLEHKLVIAGGVRSVSGSYTQQVRGIASANPRIELVEFMDKSAIRSLYQHAAAHVLPSKLETPGLSTLEALACGVPCVVGDCAPVREYFGDSVVYANHSDELSIARALQKVVTMNHDRQALRSVSSRYAWPSIVQQLQKIYKDLLSAPVGSSTITRGIA